MALRVPSSKTNLLLLCAGSGRRAKPGRADKPELYQRRSGVRVSAGLREETPHAARGGGGRRRAKKGRAQPASPLLPLQSPPDTPPSASHVLFSKILSFLPPGLQRSHPGSCLAALQASTTEPPLYRLLWNVPSLRPLSPAPLAVPFLPLYRARLFPHQLQTKGPLSQWPGDSEGAVEQQQKRVENVRDPQFGDQL